MHNNNRLRDKVKESVEAIVRWFIPVEPSGAAPGRLDHTKQAEPMRYICLFVLLPHLIYSSLSVHLDKSSLSSQLLDSSCLCPARNRLSISYLIARVLPCLFVHSSAKESYHDIFNPRYNSCVRSICYSASMLIETARSIMSGADKENC